jgi:hypothetical protein
MLNQRMAQAKLGSKKKVKPKTSIQVWVRLSKPTVNHVNLDVFAVEQV